MKSYRFEYSDVKSPCPRPRDYQDLVVLVECGGPNVDLITCWGDRDFQFLKLTLKITYGEFKGKISLLTFTTFLEPI